MTILPRLLLVSVLLGLVGFASPARAQFEPMAQAAGEQVSSAALISELDQVKAGDRFHVAIYIRMNDGWHTYWKNPGDAGLATSMSWEHVQQASVSDILWPTPQAKQEGPLVTYGYSNEVVLPIPVQAEASAAAGSTIVLRGRADWLVCKDICIPQSADLDVSIPVAEASRMQAEPHALIMHALKNRPEPVFQNIPIEVSAKNITLEVPLSALELKPKEISGAKFFAGEQNWMNYSAAQTFSKDKESIRLTLPRSDGHPDLPAAMSGVLQVELAEEEPRAFGVNLSAQSGSAGMSAGQGMQLARMMLFALLGGLILNLMPCVFPVLSLKALALAKHATLHPRHARAEGVAYTAGVLASFVFLAMLLLALKSAGEGIGWGFQMQSPVFVATLALLLFVVGLNLSGLFELPVLLGNVGHGVMQPGSLRGSFLTGVLAVAVATPCTAPFMATALGYAIAASTFEALAVFIALGLGLALPFLLIGFVPSLARMLPRPGAWMERLRGALAFPMYLSVIWLLWVLGMQSGPDSILLLLCAMVSIVFALWLRQGGRTASWVRRITVALFLVVLPVMAVSGLERMNSATQRLQNGDEVPYSAEALAQLRAEKKPVFLDATAAWCITCQVNKRVALSGQRIKDTFRERGITFMVADWTNEDPAITELLRSFGFSGVPLNVYYPPEGDPVVLPQILTETIVLNAIGAP